MVSASSAVKAVVSFKEKFKTNRIRAASAECGSSTTTATCEQWGWKEHCLSFIAPSCAILLVQ